MKLENRNKNKVCIKPFNVFLQFEMLWMLKNWKLKNIAFCEKIRRFGIFKKK